MAPAQSNQKAKGRDNQAKFETEFRDVNTFPAYSYIRAELCCGHKRRWDGLLCAACGAEVQGEEQGTVLALGAAPDAVCHSWEMLADVSWLCRGQLTCKALQQAPLLRQEISSFSHTEIFMVGSQFIAQNWKQAGSWCFYFNKTSHLYKAIKKKIRTNLFGLTRVESVKLDLVAALNLLKYPSSFSLRAHMEAILL